MIAGIEITQLIWYPESTRELEETHNPLPIQIKMPPGACIEAARAWPLGKMQRISLRYTLPLHSWDRTQQALQLSCQHSWCADTYNFALDYENNFTNKSKYNSQIGYTGNTANAILFFFLFWIFKNQKSFGWYNQFLYKMSRQRKHLQVQSYFSCHSKTFTWNKLSTFFDWHANHQ